MRPAYIYCLSDPRTDEIRYVGKTCNPAKRLRNHIEARDRVRSSAWVKSLRKDGIRPVMDIIEEFDDHDERWAESERFHITYFRFLGMRLTNHELGGLAGKLHSEETKEKMSASAKAKNFSPNRAMIEKSIAVRRTPESRERSRLAHLGQVVTDEQRKRIGDAHRGKIVSAEIRARMSEAGRGRKMPPVPQERRDRISAGMKLFFAARRAHKSVAGLTNQS